MTTLLQYAAPSTDAQGSWYAQECCAFGRAGLLSMSKYPAVIFLVTTLLQYANPSTSLRDPGMRRAAEHVEVPCVHFLMTQILVQAA